MIIINEYPTVNSPKRLGDRIREIRIRAAAEKKVAPKLPPLKRSACRNPTERKIFFIIRTSMHHTLRWVVYYTGDNVHIASRITAVENFFKFKV